MKKEIKCGHCLFSHDNPFLKPLRLINKPVHCSIHYCTVDADDTCEQAAKDYEGRRRKY